MNNLLKSIYLIVFAILIVGCSNKGINLSQHKTDQSFPIVSSKYIKYISSLDSVALEWKSISSYDVNGYYIYRGQKNKDNDNLFKTATIDDKFSSHFVDKNLNPNTTYIYAIVTIGKDDVQSYPSDIITIKTLKGIAPISFSLAVSNLPRKIKVLWRPHTNNSIKYYLIQRKDPYSKRWRDIVKLEGRLNSEYIDDNLDDDTTYSYRIIAINFNAIESAPSKIIQATTKKLPISTNDVEASTNIPKKIIISWKTLNDENIIGYAIYSSNKKYRHYKLLAKTNRYNNTYEDILNEDGEIRYYKIASIDKDNLQTAQGTLPIAQGSTLDLPKTPTIISSILDNNIVKISWKDNDDRAVYYNVYREHKTGLFKRKVKIIKNIETHYFEDNDLKNNISYSYTLEAVDSNTLKSKKTKAIIFKIKSK